MGGFVPLGYDNIDKALMINTDEAEKVQHLYSRYLELEPVKLLKEELDRGGITSKQGRAFSRGALYALLQNPIYIGKIRHKDKTYKGKHEGIIDKALWNSVQSTLKKNRHEKYLRTSAKEPSLLAGILFDEEGHSLSPTHSKKNNRRYRYYVNQTLIQFKQAPADAVTRVPAGKVEEIIEQDLLKLLKDTTHLLSILESLKISASEQHTIQSQADDLATDWNQLTSQQKIKHLRSMIKRIKLSRTRVVIEYSVSGIANNLLDSSLYNENHIHESCIPVKIQRCGLEMRLIIEAKDKQKLKPHPDSFKAIQESVKNGVIWNQNLVEGKDSSIKQIAVENKLSEFYVSKAIRMAFLSPSIIRRIFRGDIPFNLTLNKLKSITELDWNEQMRLFEK